MGHKIANFRNFILLVMAIFVFMIFMPASPTLMEQYSLSAGQYRVLYFIVMLPFAAIWFTAAYGCMKLRQYASTISDTPEGPGMQTLSNGFCWLTWGMPIQSLLNMIVSSIANLNPGFLPAATIINNYVALFFPLIAFIYISNGARSLILQSKEQLTASMAKNIQLLFVGLGVVYCFLTFRNLDLNSLGSSENVYFLPVWLLVLTLIVPYLYSWFIGLLAAYEIKIVAAKVKGTLYRQALQLLASGVVLIVVSQIAGSYIRSVVPRTNRVSLSLLLMFIYLFYMIIAAGFVLLAMGSKRLKKIEDI